MKIQDHKKIYPFIQEYLDSCIKCSDCCIKSYSRCKNKELALILDIQYRLDGPETYRRKNLEFYNKVEEI